MSEVTYKIRVNRPCRLFIDDEEVMILEESKLTKINLPEGEYLRKVVAVGNDAIFDEVVIVLSGAAKMDLITLSTEGLEDAKRNALPNEMFKVGDLYFMPSKDRLSVEVTSKVADKFLYKASGEEYIFETVNIPEKIVYGGYTYPVTSIGYQAFRYCSSLTSITIPNSVTSIGELAFTGCSSLTSITIPNSVTSIGKWAFTGCSSLTSITIPNSVTSIEWSAFGDCSSLTSVSIPNSVTSIGGLAFDGCKSLTSITIPNSVTSIERVAFYDRSELKSIVVESGNTVYDSRGNCNAIIEIATNTLIAGCQNTIIPNSVTSIGERAFAGCSSLTSITIPNSVTSIEEYAFAGCSSLTSITIPNSVTSIGASAFCGCKSLTELNYDGTKDEWKNIEKSERWNKDSNVQVVCCSDGNMKSTMCTNNLEDAKRNALPDEAFKVGDLYFMPSKDRLSVEVTGNKDDKYIFENINIPEQIVYGGYTYPVTSIGNYAFSDCKSLTSITIPNSVTSIGYEVFRDCSSLTSITIPNSVTSIVGFAFMKCKSLTSITIPNSVTSIGDYAFYGCYSLTSITIPNSVKSIGDKAFRYCKSLTSITIPSSVTSIGKFAFSDCKSLTSITIPSSVTSIGDSAFYCCYRLTSITIPNSVTSIGENAFLHCKLPTTLNYAGTKEEWKKIEKDEGWNNYSNIQVIRCTDGEIRL